MASTDEELRQEALKRIRSRQALSGSVLSCAV